MEEHADVQVVDGVLGAVVVGVHLDAGGSSEDGDLLGGLDVVGAGVETAAWDADVKEGTVVGAAVELGCLPWGTILVGVEVLEQLLGLGATGCAGDVESRSIAVVDSVHEVGRGNHVEVEIETNLGVLLGAERSNVGFGSEKSFLFGRPPGETDGVLDGKGSELEGDFEDTDSTGSVVVNSWASFDRVGVGTEVENVVWVSSLSLCYDVVANFLSVGISSKAKVVHT